MGTLDEGKEENFKILSDFLEMARGGDPISELIADFLTGTFVILAKNIAFSDADGFTPTQLPALIEKSCGESVDRIKSFLKVAP